MAKKRIFNGKQFFLKYEALEYKDSMEARKKSLINQGKLVRVVTRKEKGKIVYDVYFKSKESRILTRPKDYEEMKTRLEKYILKSRSLLGDYRMISLQDLRFKEDKSNLKRARNKLSSAILELSLLLARLEQNVE